MLVIIYYVSVLLIADRVDVRLRGRSKRRRKKEGKRKATELLEVEV